jgi:hypothetical protein
MKRKLSILVLFFSVLLLGAKGCEAGAKAGTKTPAVHEINTKEDIIEMLPELNKYAGKFDVKRYDDFIQLITNDDLSFREAVHKLKTETSMNIPAYIILYDDKKEFLDKEGELKLELNAGKVVLYTGRELAPYLGVIFIFDGYWTAVEFNAIALFAEKINNDDGKISVTEYAYVNEAVFRNNMLSERAFLSRFNEDIEGERVKGDGSIPNEIVTEFDK